MAKIYTITPTEFLAGKKHWKPKEWKPEAKTEASMEHEEEFPTCLNCGEDVDPNKAGTIEDPNSAGDFYCNDTCYEESCVRVCATCGAEMILNAGPRIWDPRTEQWYDKESCIPKGRG